MIYIYILLLTDNKYYIGKTTNPKFRLKAHFNFNGSAWTNKYKPIKVIDIISNCDNYDEDKYTLKYMKDMGINNVRGGSFCQIVLSDEQIELITTMIRCANDKCYNCGESGHFVKNCKKLEVSKFLEYYINEDIQETIHSIKSIYEEILTIKYWIEKTLVTNVSEKCQIILAYNNLPKKECVFEKQTPHHLKSNITKCDRIKLCEVTIFNLKKKNRLKEIYQTYESEEFVVELLSELYSREIKSLNDLIFVNKK